MPTTLLTLGACTVTYNSVAMGDTSGGVEVTFDYNAIEHASDQSSTLEEIFLVARGITATVPLQENDLAKLQYAFPDGTYVLDSGGIKKKITLGNGTTIKLSGVAYALVLDPVNDATDNEIVTIHKAVVSSAITVRYAKEGVRIWQVQFKGLRDTTKSAGNQLCTIGDTTATA